MDPPTGRPVTRSKNANQHPGKVVQMRKRRTKAEVEEERALLRAKKEAEKQKQNEGIARVAQLEDKMALDDANIGSSHPRSQRDVYQRGATGHGTRQREGSEDGTEQHGKRHKPRKGRASQPGHAETPKKDRRGITGNSDATPKHFSTTTTGDKSDSDESGSIVKGSLPTRMSRKSGRFTIMPVRRQDLDAIEDLSGDGAVEGVSQGRQGGKPKVVAKVQMKSKQSTVTEKHKPTTQPKEAQTVRRSVELDSNQTDVDDDPTPMKGRGALKRSFAIANVGEISATADAQKRRSKYGETFSDDEYEIATGPEKDPGMPVGTSEAASLSSDSFDDDDDPTPKKKSRKLSLREAVGASRKEPEPPRREQMKICDKTTSTKTSKSTAGIIESWAAKVNSTKAKNGSKALSSLSASVHASSEPSSTAFSATRTTSSSNALIIPAKDGKKPARSKNGTDDLVDFFEEDEAEEREAALSSPIKGHQRLSSKAIVKIGHASPAPTSKRLHARKTNADLPSGTLDNATWRRTFIPTYLQFLASRDVKEAWSIDDDEATALLQNVWNYVYGQRIPYTVVVTGSVFHVADQRVCEWRSAFASTAIAILDALFEDLGLNTDAERQEFAASALKDYTFLYRDVYEQNGKLKRKGIFRGPVVIQTFSSHYHAIRGAESPLPALGAVGRPGIALSLSAAAAERAFYLWKEKLISYECETADQDARGKKARKKASAIRKTVNQTTGKESTMSTNFNLANWGSATDSYFRSVKKNLSNGEDFDLIIKEAISIANANRRPDSGGNSVTDNELANDERACLADDDSD